MCTFYIHVCLYSCKEDLTVIKTAVMNSTKSKDFKPTQTKEEVVERINALHGYVIIIAHLSNWNKTFILFHLFTMNVLWYTLQDPYTCMFTVD